MIGTISTRISVSKAEQTTEYPLSGSLSELEQNTHQQYDKLYIVGGGAKNEFLNHLIEEATGKQIIALPIEAAALGNLKIQLEVMA
ncbi:MAG: FGGY-family carbohydrate kinase [Oscillospiraceae bacterium]